MSVTLHAHAEIKIAGKWEHLGMFRPDENLDLFNKMGERFLRERHPGKFDEAPLAVPRGLPPDLSTVTKFEADDWLTDECAHDFSWFSYAEMGELRRWFEEQPFGRGLDHVRAFARQFGYVFGGDWGDWVVYPEDRREGIEDARLVFWFTG